MGEEQPVGPDRGGSILVPTFQEAGNIAPPVQRVPAALAGEGVDWALLFVDDDLRDGSEEIVADRRHSTRSGG